MITAALLFELAWKSLLVGGAALGRAQARAPALGRRALVDRALRPRRAAAADPGGDPGAGVEPGPAAGAVAEPAGGARPCWSTCPSWPHATSPPAARIRKRARRRRGRRGLSPSRESSPFGSTPFPLVLLLLAMLVAVAPAVRDAPPRRGAGRGAVARRAGAGAAAHGLQARHRAAGQRRAALAGQLGHDAPDHPAQPGGDLGDATRPRRSSPTSSPTSRGSTGPSCCWRASPARCSGSIRWSGCSPARATSCARKRPTMRCC